MPRSFLDHQAKWFPEGSLADLPDVEALRHDPASGARILGWALEPGDAVAFHMLTLHAAGGVEGPDRRRVFSLRLLGDDMVHAPRAWATSPDFPGLADELPAGAPLDHPLFPRLV
jgi:ectoine hydroxylase-related dioxygenase (phytanoyl-CoA dioxygenase family)